MCGMVVLKKNSNGKIKSNELLFLRPKALSGQNVTTTHCLIGDKELKRLVFSLHYWYFYLHSTIVRVHPTFTCVEIASVRKIAYSAIRFWILLCSPHIPASHVGLGNALTWPLWYYRNGLVPLVADMRGSIVLYLVFIFVEKGTKPSHYVVDLL